MKKIEFETFKDVSSSYTISQLQSGNPSCINFLSYRKYKVTIELIEEDKDVLIDRLMNLDHDNNHHRRSMIDNEIKKLKSN